MELKLSDEQYEKIAELVYGAWPETRAMMGRAAVDAVLAEVLPVVREEIRKLSHPEDGRIDLWVFTDAIDSVFARFTVPKDAAVEAVREFLANKETNLTDAEIADMVAAVRAADREAGR